MPYWIYRYLKRLGIKYKPVRGGGIFYFGEKEKFVPSYEIDKANKMASARYCSEEERIQTFLEWIGVQAGKP
ncbi:MAG: hypothetical protein N2V78_09525 [Methanophagales archaeon]|nr:hypothetical protein [Methanophagales archaeon]